MTSAQLENPGGDPTESYLDNDTPKLMKLLFWGLIVWGIVFAAYFILTGYDSEKDFDAAKSGQSAVVRVTDTRLG